MDMSDPYTVVFGFILDHPFFLGAILFVDVVCFLIIIVRGSSSKIKNTNDTNDTYDTYDEKHITTNTNEHRSASTETLLYCCLLLIVVLIFTKL